MLTEHCRKNWTQYESELAEYSTEFKIYEGRHVVLWDDMARFHESLLAKEVGLEPVLDYEDDELEKHLQKKDAGRLMKHFAPRFPPESDPSLTVASALFCTFVFRKRSDGDDVEAGGKGKKRKATSEAHD